MAPAESGAPEAPRWKEPGFYPLSGTPEKHPAKQAASDRQQVRA